MIYFNVKDVDFVGIEGDGWKRKRRGERSRYSINIDEAKWC